MIYSIHPFSFTFLGSGCSDRRLSRVFQKSYYLWSRGIHRQNELLYEYNSVVSSLLDMQGNPPVLRVQGASLSSVQATSFRGKVAAAWPLESPLNVIQRGVQDLKKENSFGQLLSVISFRGLSRAHDDHTVGEVWTVDPLVNPKLSNKAQVPFHHKCLAQCHIGLYVLLMLYLTVTQQIIPNPERAVHYFPADTCGFRLCPSVSPCPLHTGAEKPPFVHIEAHSIINQLQSTLFI